MNYSELNLPETLHRSLERMNFTTPTPIQEATIPLGLAGRDVLGTAQTGTGKTAAFAIPVVAHILANPEQTALILLPTRELATQVLTVVRELLGTLAAAAPAEPRRGDKWRKDSKPHHARREHRHSHEDPNLVHIALLIGGDSLMKQFSQLRNNPRIVVGTPGRVIDHLTRGTLDLSQANMLVLDETDRMLDMGFGIQLEEIVAALPTPRQTLMFSATMPQNIVKLSRKYLVNPERVEIGSTTAVAANIQQDLVRTPEGGKFNVLKEELEKREGTVIIFVKTKIGCDRLADKLDAAGYSAAPIHGDLRQRERDRVVRDFRSQRFRILVATDVAARGLDIPHIAHVVNYDLPQNPEDFIHRLGRTARAGAEGAAVSFIAPDDHAKWRAIHKLLNPTERLEGFEGGDRPRKGRGGFGGAGGGARRPFGGRNDRRDGPSSDYKPRREFGDRPANDFKPRRDSSSPRADRAFDDRPRSEGDRPRYNDKPRGEAPKGDFKPRREFDNRPARAEGERAPRQYSDKPRGERPARADGDRPFRADGARPARPARAAGDFAPRGDRPARPAGRGDKPGFAPKAGAPRTGERKNYVRAEGEKRSAPKRERKAAW